MRSLTFKNIFGSTSDEAKANVEEEQNIEAEEDKDSEDADEARLDFMVQIPTQEAVVNDYLSATTSHGSYFTLDDVVYFVHARLNEHAQRRANATIQFWRGDAYDIAPPQPGIDSWWNHADVGGFASWQTHQTEHANTVKWTFTHPEWCYIGSGEMTVVPEDELGPVVTLRAGDLAYFRTDFKCTIVTPKEVIKKVLYKEKLPEPPAKK